MKLALIILALIVYFLTPICPKVYAGDWAMVTGLSKHSEPGYCEVNPGAGYRHDLNDDWSVMVFRYRNSLCRMSNAFAVCYHPLHVGSFSAGACPGIVSGYSDRPEFLPIPTASYNLSRDTAFDFIIGTDGRKSVLGGGVRFRF